MIQGHMVRNRNSLLRIGKYSPKQEGGSELTEKLGKSMGLRGHDPSQDIYITPTYPNFVY